MLTGNCSVTRQTELHFRHRVPYSSGWITSSATRDCLSWHRILWRLPSLKPMLNDYSRWQQENRTELGCPCIGVYFWNWTVTFCIELNVLWLLKCNLFLWYCRTARRPVAETAFLTFADLLNVVISRTTLTYMSKLKRQRKRKWLA